MKVFDTDHDFCFYFLDRVSRTFALTIRLLPVDLGFIVANAYLIARIADTIEDDLTLCSEEKVRQLKLLDEGLTSEAKILEFLDSFKVYTSTADEEELLRNTDRVFEIFYGFEENIRNIITRWIREMISGMIHFSETYESGVRIKTMNELHRYCYFVAGTIGYMLTEMFALHSKQASLNDLLVNCEDYGVALQLINILRDIRKDASLENNIYIPQQELEKWGAQHSDIKANKNRKGTTQVLTAILSDAEKKLKNGISYYNSIPHKDIQIRLFLGTTLLLSFATLREMKSQPEKLLNRSPVKISRWEVLTLASLIKVPYAHLFLGAISKMVLWSGWAMIFKPFTNNFFLGAASAKRSI